MVMKKSYYSVGGEIIGEKSGGVRTDYLTDALGSVTATVDQAGSVINRYTYKPYGALLAKTGVGAIRTAFECVFGLMVRRCVR